MSSDIKKNGENKNDVFLEDCPIHLLKLDCPFSEKIIRMDEDVKWIKEKLQCLDRKLDEVRKGEKYEIATLISQVAVLLTLLGFIMRLMIG